VLIAVVAVAVCVRVWLWLWGVQDAIRSGVDNFDSGIGVYAGDEEVYTVFAPLLDRVIESYHRHPPVSALCCALCYAVYCAVGERVTMTVLLSRSLG
jgi:hypothetical protein